MASISPTIKVTRGAVTQGLAERKPDWRGLVFQVILVLALLACLAFLIVLLYDVISKGRVVYQTRGTDFLTSNLSRLPAQAGIAQGIVGSITIAVITAVVAFPLGIATAVYLEEYARDNWFTRFIALNIRNLAGVPSVVYGLLGLTVFVQWLGTDLSDSGGLTGGRTVLSAGLTIAVLVLPLVIITAAEAVRAVPRALREGGYGVGATKWEVTRTLVLPNAAPGILTGTVLAISRALGETAPLILIGAVSGGGFLSTGDLSYMEQLREGGFTALPMIVYGWARQPGADFRNELAPAAIIALLVLTLITNAIAIVLRNRYEKRFTR